MRVFVAVDISREAKKEVEKLLKILARKHWKVKWESVTKLHLTLAFLGNIKEGNVLFKNRVEDTSEVAERTPRRWREKYKVDVIKEAIKRVCKDTSPFEISFKGLGCFPDYDQPRVIWLGLKGDLKSLARLQKGICAELVKVYESVCDRTANSILLGLKRPFSAHLTLGRIKARFRERREIGRQLSKIKEPCPHCYAKHCRRERLKSKIFSDCKSLIDRVVIYESKLSRLGSTYQKLSEILL